MRRGRLQKPTEIAVKVVKPKRKPYFVLRWIDPKTGKQKERSTDTRIRRDAERAAQSLEDQIREGLLEPDDVAWSEFRKRYESEKLPSLKPKSGKLFKTAANQLERHCNPACIREVDSSMLSQFAAKLRANSVRETSIAAYLRMLKAALGWAQSIAKVILEVPAIDMPKRARGVSKLMRSRPIRGEEFERILMAVDHVRPDDAPSWKKFISGLWHSGFRVSELTSLSWDPGAEWSIEFVQKIPFVRILADGQKSHEDQFQPITPEFWELIRDTPRRQRRGPVFVMTNSKTGKPMQSQWILDVIARIGARAGVITNAADKKSATSHDIGRRAFATRMGKTLSQTELAAWMRHADPQTTQRYYYAQDARDLASRVWQAVGDPSGDHCESGEDGAAINET